MIFKTITRKIVIQLGPLLQVIRKMNEKTLDDDFRLVSHTISRPLQTTALTNPKWGPSTVTRINWTWGPCILISRTISRVIQLLHVILH